MKDKNLFRKKVLEIVNVVLREGGFHAVMRSWKSVKPFLEVETYFFVWNLISVYISWMSNYFLIWTTWSLLQDVQLNYF